MDGSIPPDQTESIEPFVRWDGYGRRPLTFLPFL